MKTRIGWILVAAAALGLAACAEDEHHESKHNEIPVTMDQVPPPVKATIVRESEGGTIGDIDKETKHDKLVYEADASISGTNYEIKVAEDGTLLSKKLDNEEQEKGGDKD
jgi:uncharacterized membrane protein YkoI